MRLRFSCLLFLLAVPFFLSSSIHAQSPAKPAGGSIRGTVYDPAGSVVPGAKVNLLDSLAAVAQTETDARGRYKFAGLDAGSYTVAASRPGLSKVSPATSLKSGENITLDLHLELAAVQEQVVVSSSLGGGLAEQVGSSVTVVSGQEMQNEGAITLSDALRNVPGIEISRSGQLGTLTSAFIRGGESDYNLVMIDGIPMNDFGGGYDLSPLPVDGVEDMEVTRGPQSALYGSNAVAGMINVVTTPGEGPPQFSWLGEGGSYDTYRLATQGEGLTHGLSWMYSLSRLSSQGMVMDDSYLNQTSFLTLGYSRSPRRKFIAHFFGDAGRDVNPGPFGSNPDGLYPGIAAAAVLQVQDEFGYQASYTEQFSSRFQQVSTVSVATDKYSFPSPFGSSFTKNLRLVASTRSEMTLSAKDVLVAGFDYDRESFENTYVVNTGGLPFTLPRDTYAFYAENRWNAGNRLFLSAGVRVDTIQTGSLAPDPNSPRPFIPAASVTQADPRISAAYLARQGSGGMLGVTRFHSSFGAGIRAPDGFELAFTNNPGLKPERSISMDAGVEQHFFGDRAIFDVTYFYNRFTDQIVVLGGSLQNLSTFTSANVANSRAYGIESSLRLHPVRSLALMAEYTWTRTAYLALNGTSQFTQFPFQVGDPFLRVPISAAGFDATWTIGRLMLNSNASIRGAVMDLEPNYGSYACVLGFQCLFANPGFVDVNAGFAYRLPRGIEIYGHVDNLLNEKYEEVFGYPALRLNFISGLRLNFPGRRQSGSD